jgi:hypothetical protein
MVSYHPQPKTETIEECLMTRFTPHPINCYTTDHSSMCFCFVTTYCIATARTQLVVLYVANNIVKQNDLLLVSCM